uniref:TetR/AcrR family transcriptional regulator n=1 Tax=Kineococcus sp. SYSU DK001 TaxID=3383122 RepID=UPI003D7D465F
MPKVVDHEQRRREIVRAYLRMAAQDGLTGITSRALAGRLGIAAGALWHYFPTMDAVLVAAYDQVFADTDARIDDATGDRTGLRAVDAVLRELLPLGTVTALEAQVVVSFWGLLPSRPDLAERHRVIDGSWRARQRVPLARPVPHPHHPHTTPTHN